jgi:hypothetical protein
VWSPWDQEHLASDACTEAPVHYVCGYRSVENKINRVRDVTFRKYSSPSSGGAHSRILVTLRNLDMGLIRQTGHDDIAAPIRAAEHDNTMLHALLPPHTSHVNRKNGFVRRPTYFAGR